MGRQYIITSTGEIWSALNFKRIMIAAALRRNKGGATQKESYAKRIITKLQDKNDFVLVQHGGVESEGCYLDIFRYFPTTLLNFYINYYILSIAF